MNTSWVNPHAWGLHKFLRPLRPIVSPIVERPSRRRLADAVNVADLRIAAEKRMHRMCFGYLDSGADDEVTLRRNKEAYGDYALHYHVLSGIKRIDLSTTLFGEHLELPFFPCPCAGNRMFHTEGEPAVYETAASRGMAYAMSALATTPVSAVRGGPPLKIFQLYLWRDRALVADVLSKAKEAGFKVLALTCDLTWLGNRERDKRNNFTIPPAYTPRQIWDALRAPAWTWDFLSTDPYTYANLNAEVPAESLADYVNSQLRTDYSIFDAKELLELWDGPVVLKGVVRPLDAEIAIEAGFAGVWLSNHGGRQLDGAPAAIEVLADVRKRIGVKPIVVLDGGVQRGTDIFKALALGADAVGIGKPYLYGLGAGGKRGVEKCVDILHRELETTMGLTGVEAVRDLKSRGEYIVKKR
ncbi:hypothetical protein CTAYLR_007109 [Chrysophaeum taylorii]|uniref:FMN hydroxy acid dehydrogenase domain-containing protein n=1 Tax=Chrysophaeum taylorii TaxID=2483200 RepID=A0AAD7XIM0_9STRA|nr:hypothetical protein CTAYLR_007109 [Chrysophaeum taylorii]